MKRPIHISWLLVGFSVLAAIGCSAGSINPEVWQPIPPTRAVATFDRQVTGVTVAPDGRMFVCFPYWSEDQDLAVAEVLEDGSLRAYPDTEWNSFRLGEDVDDAFARFICVQSVVADDEGSLWVLDPAAPMFEGPIEDGPKLVRIDLTTDTVRRVIPFEASVAPQGSYLNDVRIDTQRDFAYITDSGLGAIIVVDLDTGEARRLLDDDDSTKAEDIEIVIEGKPWTGPDGKTPAIHADGIALSPDRDWLYYHALTGRTLYRVPTEVLRDRDAAPDAVAAAVENLGQDVVCDGIIMDAAGNLYLTALEDNAIVRRGVDGTLTTLVRHPELRWPDTFSIGPDGVLYVSVSQIHLMPGFNDGENRVTEDWTVMRVGGVD